MSHTPKMLSLAEAQSARFWRLTRQLLYLHVLQILTAPPCFMCATIMGFKSNNFSCTGMRGVIPMVWLDRELWDQAAQ